MHEEIKTFQTGVYCYLTSAEDCNMTLRNALVPCRDDAPDLRDGDDSRSESEWSAVSDEGYVDGGRLFSKRARANRTSQRSL